MLVKDINSGPSPHPGAHLADVSGTIFFAADDAANGIELWKSDGTAAGTVLVKDINPASGKRLEPNGADKRGRHAFFAAQEALDGPELWKSDGTTAGTALLKDINPGGASSGH